MQHLNIGGAKNTIFIIMVLPNREHDGEVDGEETRDAILVESPHGGKTK